MKPTEQEPDDDATEAAFVQGGHKIGDVELQPFSPSRVVAAQSMGLHYGALNDDEVAEYRKTGLYPQAAQDVAIVLWLCAIEDEREIARASRYPEQAFIKACEWANDRGLLNRAQQPFWEAYHTFETILAEIHASRTKPEGGGGTTGPKAKRRSRRSGPTSAR